MTDSMIERVARALDPEVWSEETPVPTRAGILAFHSRRQASVSTARVAIDAMREPTTEMNAAGFMAMNRHGKRAVHEIFNTMIDAALKEGKTDE